MNTEWDMRKMIFVKISLSLNEELLKKNVWVCNKFYSGVSSVEFNEHFNICQNYKMRKQCEKSYLCFYRLRKKTNPKFHDHT